MCLATLEGDIHGAHWDQLRSLLPLYQAITTVTVGNGENTSFWYDVWAGDESLAEQFPVLLSHCKKPRQTVFEVINGGPRCHLVRRLTQQAEAELELLEDKLSHFTLMDTDDRRSSPFADTSGKLCTSTLYAVLKSRGAEAGSANSAFWRSCAPPRVQFFGWLLIHGRVQCKTSLLQRKVVQDSTCELCNREPETASHLIFHCAFAASFWQTLGFQLPATLGVQDIPQLP